MKFVALMSTLVTLAVGLAAVPVASAKTTTDHQKIVWVHVPGVTHMPCNPLKVSCSIAHAASYETAWVNSGAHIEYYAGRYYADWQCDVGGTIVAGAAWWIWLTPGPTALGIVAGLAFTVGCHEGADYNKFVSGGYYSDSPHEMYSDCWEVFPGGSRARRYEECIA